MCCLLTEEKTISDVSTRQRHDLKPNILGSIKKNKPIQALVVVVSIKELNLFERLRAVVITDNGWVHGEKCI